MKWNSRGIEINPIFVNWLWHTNTLVIPSLENKKMPLSAFSSAKTLITIDWKESFIKKNLNKTVFPNVKTVLMLDSKRLTHVPNSDFKITRGFEEGFIRGNQIFWNETLVNKEWLESQYNEYLVEIQEIRENELR